MILAVRIAIRVGIVTVRLWIIARDRGVWVHIDALSVTSAILIPALVGGCISVLKKSACLIKPLRGGGLLIITALPATIICLIFVEPSIGLFLVFYRLSLRVTFMNLLAADLSGRYPASALRRLLVNGNIVDPTVLAILVPAPSVVAATATVVTLRPAGVIILTLVNLWRILAAFMFVITIPTAFVTAVFTMFAIAVSITTTMVFLTIRRIARAQQNHQANRRHH